MNAEDRERQLDQWLDQALARYSDAEPRPGLEQRILANLEAQPQRPWWQWAWIPVAAAVVLAVGVFWITRHRAQAPVPPTVRVEKEAPAPPKFAPQPAPQTVRAGLHPRRAVTKPALPVVAVQASEPRRAVFPSPAPLSAEEIAALRLLQGDPAEAIYLAQAQEAERERLKKMLEEAATSRKGGER